jgi:PhnB protein
MMMRSVFKPAKYNSVSPYLIVNGAQQLIDLMKTIFDAKELRRDDRPDGTIRHAEIQIDDSVIMLSDSSDQFPPISVVMHVYVTNVDEIYNTAIRAGCEIVDQPEQKDGENDRRGTFKDFAGNMWSIGTQQQQQHINSGISKSEIAQAFSGGQFQECFDYMTNETIWNTPGEHYLTGKDEIVPFCNNIAAYFKSVTTKFTQLNLVENDNCVTINGTAEFIKNDKRVSFISSCDVYQFTSDNKLLTITSYCITDRSEKE